MNYRAELVACSKLIIGNARAFLWLVQNILFPALCIPGKLGWPAGFLWFLMLMSLLLLVWQDTHHKHNLDQTERTQYDSVIVVNNSDFFFWKKNKQYLLLSHWVCSHRGGRKEDGVNFFKSDCFQVLQFSRNHKPHGVLGLVDILNYFNYLSVPPYPAHKIVSLWFEEFAWIISLDVE